MQVESTGHCTVSKRVSPGNFTPNRSQSILGFETLMSKIAAHLSLFVQLYLPFLAGRADFEWMLSSFLSPYRKTGNIAHFQYLIWG